MSQLTAATSCTHSALGHLMHPLCPAQSDLKKVANIAIPLFVILGAIYYGWRYFNTPIPLEQYINNLIAEKQYDKAKELIKKVDQPEKRDLLSDTLHEAISIDRFVTIEQQAKSPGNELASQNAERGLTRVKDEAILIKDPSKKDSLLERIFDSYLKITDIKKALLGAQELIEEFADPSKRGEIRKRFVNTAIEKKVFPVAFAEALKLDWSDAKSYFVHLAENGPLTVDHILNRISLHFNGDISKKDEFLAKFIPLFIDKKYLKFAHNLTKSIYNKRIKFNVLENIFKVSLAQKELSNAYEVLKDIRLIGVEYLSPTFVEAAIQGNLELAAEAAMTMEGPKKQECFDLVAPKIAENFSNFIQTELFKRKRFNWPGVLLIKVVQLLMADKKFTEASTMAKKLPESERYNWLKKIEEAKQSVEGAPLNKPNDFQTETSGSSEENFKVEIRDKDLPSARKIIKNQYPEEQDQFRQTFIDTAIQQGWYEGAFGITIELTDDSKHLRKNYFEQLAPKMALNIEPFKEMLTKIFVSKLALDQLYEEIICVFIDGEYWNPALEMGSIFTWDKRDFYFEKIFHAFLKKGKIAEAYGVLEKTSKDKRKTLNAPFMTAAIEKKEYVLATKGIQALDNEDEKRECFKHLVVEIVKSPDWWDRSQLFPEKADFLYAGMTVSLIPKKKFAFAKAWANRVSNDKLKTHLLKVTEEAEKPTV